MEKKNRGDKRSYIFTKETLGMTILLFCLIIFIMLLTNDLVFGVIGNGVCTFLYGTFGYASYIVVALLAYLGEWLVFEKKLSLDLRSVLFVSATVAMLFLLFHAVTTAGHDITSYGAYLTDCFMRASQGFGGYSFGGVICGIIVYPFAVGTQFIAAYVVFSLLTVLFGVFSFLRIRRVVLGDAVAKAAVKTQEEASDAATVDEVRAQSVDHLYAVNENHEIVTRAHGAQRGESAPEAQEKPAAASSDESKYAPENLGRKILFQPGEFAAESYRRNMIYNDESYFNHPVRNDGDYLKSFSSGNSQSGTRTPSPDTTYTQDYSDAAAGQATQSTPPSYVYGDAPVENLDDVASDRDKNYSAYTVDGGISSTAEEYFGDTDDSEELTAPLQVDEEELGIQPETKPTTDEINAYRTADRIPTEIVKPEITEEQRPVVRPDEHAVEPTPAVKPEETQAPRQRGGNLFSLFSSSNPRLNEQSRGIEPDASVLKPDRRTEGRDNLFDEDGDNLFGDDGATNSRRGVESDRRSLPVERQPEAPKPVKPVAAVVPQPTEPPKEEKPKHVWKKYVRPALSLLDDYPENNNVNTAEIEDSKKIICETLANFRIESRISNVVVGPAITRYDVIIEDRTNIKNAMKYREAIAMALMKENVTVYLNYSKGAISIEVPNTSRTIVGLKSMLASSAFINSKPNALNFALGKNIEGQVICPDITKMPHLLVAGTTGSGKSICLSALIISLLYKYGPAELRFILVDPKQVEFISYDKLPHLMINEIIADVDKSIKALNWAIKEMERRYQLFREMTESGTATKTLEEYNAHLPEGEEKLPKIVIILDEFGDLMLQAKKDVETRIIRLVQKSRACGIHLILATQRPSVDCITGLIKSNLPTRIGFKVNSFDDARCIFDIGGAEKLLGKGDLYFRSADSPDLTRIQGCFIDTHEVQRVTDFVKQNNETYFDQSVSDFINTVEEPDEEPADDGAAAGDTKVDDTFLKALKFCVWSNQASVSMIQRRFPIGYMKACKIIDWMENMNYITQSEGSKPRKVLLSREEFTQKYGEIDD